MLLSASDLRSGYATSDVLQDVSVTVEQGEVVGVLGRNGVGKTTLMKTLIGLLPARSGQIVFRDQDVTKLSADKRARLGIGYVPQGRGIFPQMTVRDNLRMGGLINASKQSLDFDLVFGYFPFLKQRLTQRGGTLSGGQQAMLAIARALISTPDLLLLDEPSDGVQPNIVEEIGDFIKILNREKGLTVLIVEQNIDLMQTVATRAYALDKGRVVASVNHEELMDTQRVAAFLAI
ncbi:MAG: ABC transporter ATP-binding protein [Proteobacteria bacterium]|nr:ABC transporter ATP-binding protein [Pseudomonadota bacterium]